MKNDLKINNTTAPLLPEESPLRFCEKQRATLYPRGFVSEQDRRTAIKIGLPRFREALANFKKSLAPASPVFITTKLELLRSRYHRITPPQDPQDFATWQRVETELQREWIEDLADYPAAFIDLACKKWRNSSKEFAPRSAGNLMALVAPEIKKHKATVSRLTLVIFLLELEENG